MGYIRVIPRDLFNEASLLKCYGKLAIALEVNNVPACRLSAEDMDAFEIVQRDDDGAITIEGLTLLTAAHEYELWRPLNSREPWPLYAERIAEGLDPVAVFNRDGALSEDFKLLIRGYPSA